MTRRKSLGRRFRWNRIMAMVSGASLAQLAGCQLEGIQDALAFGAIQAVAGDAFGIIQGVLLDVFRV